MNTSWLWSSRLQKQSCSTLTPKQKQHLGEWSKTKKYKEVRGNKREAEKGQKDIGKRGFVFWKSFCWTLSESDVEKSWMNTEIKWKSKGPNKIRCIKNKDEKEQVRTQEPRILKRYKARHDRSKFFKENNKI